MEYRQLANLRAFLRSLAERVAEDQVLLWAGALTYASLLALVPLTAVAFGVLSAFPVFVGLSQRLRQFVFEHFVPETGQVVQQYLDRFVDRTAELSAVGVLFLVLSSLLLMFNIERAINRIWRAPRPRPLGRRLPVYWTVLTLGPLLLGASLAVTSYVAGLPWIERTTEGLGLQSAALRLMTALLSFLVFTLMYSIVPNRSVPWRPAAGGALLAALLFEGVNGALGFYVRRFPTYEVIYGAFAAVPIFLVWVYLSWLVILFGATFGAAVEAVAAGAGEEEKAGEEESE